MAEPLKKRSGEYTYADYLTWPDEERWELIDGIAYNMTPAPSRRHQEILGELHRQISSYLIDKPCKVYVAPFDVRFIDNTEEDNDIKNVVQPDISVICDESKLDERGCKGSPDLIIEITSPSTAKKDMKEKYFLYEKYGVKEYWIVHIPYKTVNVYRLGKNNEYGKVEVYGEDEKIKIGVIDGLTIDLKRVFGE
ncbi:MAG: hypothetical protein PWR10_1008 [Halanaerobiales bacterium]|nr:hypothetical protein [Halanaerobiales bacterium]